MSVQVSFKHEYIKKITVFQDNDKKVSKEFNYHIFDKYMT